MLFVWSSTHENKKSQKQIIECSQTDNLLLGKISGALNQNFDFRFFLPFCYCHEMLPSMVCIYFFPVFLNSFTRTFFSYEKNSKRFLYSVCSITSFSCKILNNQTTNIVGDTNRESFVVYFSGMPSLL